MISASVKEAFDEACGDPGVELTLVEDMAGNRREFTFKAAGRVFVVGCVVEGNSPEALAATAGLLASGRAARARLEKVG